MHGRKVDDPSHEVDLWFRTTVVLKKASGRWQIVHEHASVPFYMDGSLRAAVDLVALGSRTLWVDCDVLQADGGTRTAAITGACVAMGLACRTLLEAGKISASPIRRKVAAVSVGLVEGEALLDLNYEEDKEASVDMNLVMTDQLEFVELQGSGEEAVFSDSQLAAMLELGKAGIRRLVDIQESVL
jgi:ribonuclease PH